MIVRPSFTPKEDQNRLLQLISETIGLSEHENIFRYADYFLKHIDEPLRFRIESDLSRNNLGDAQVRIDQWLFENLDVDNTTFSFQNLKIATNGIYSNDKDDYTFELEDEYFIDSESKYSGTYASDFAGLSDDFIDDVLGGDPDAYWNID